MLIEEQLLRSAIGHFRDALSLCVKTGLCAKTLTSKCISAVSSFFIQVKLILLRKVLHDDFF